MNLLGRSTVSFRSLPSILLFGDSITEFGFGLNGQIGWASLLSSTYSRRADVVSRGFAGYNTEHAKQILPSILGTIGDGGGISDGRAGTTRTPLLFCTVFFGANDASLPTARQHLALEDYCDNMREIITTIRSHIDDDPIDQHPHSGPDEPIVSSLSSANKNTLSPTSTHDRHPTPIILFTPPPVAPKAWDHFCTITSPRPLSPRSNANCKLYASALKEIGKEMDCPVVDTYQLLGGDEGEEFYGRYLVDGIHLTGEGNSLVYDGLMEVIRDYRGILPLVEGEEDSGGVPLDQKLWSEMC